MKKYFYKCPFQALHMMKEFGIKVGIWEPNYDRKKTHRIKDGFMTEIPDMFIEFSMRDIVGNLNELCDDELKKVEEEFAVNLYVSPDSISLLKPKYNDIGVAMSLASGNYEEGMFNGTKWIYRDRDMKNETARIIMREYRPFFVPEAENA